MPMPQSLIILGASARAAAHSAVRAAMSPAAIDLFGDADLRRVAPTLVVEDYPAGLVRMVRELPAGPWMYTGGLENHPEVVAAIARQRRLLGNGAEIIRRVRDPIELHRVLELAGCPAPDVSMTSDGLARDGSWLRKPLASAGGRGVDRYDDNSDAQRAAVYYQRYVAGRSYSAVFIGCGPTARLIGVTAQQHAALSAGGTFCYLGSVGPIRLSERLQRAWQAIGDALVGQFGLVGLFGVDAIVDDAGRVWPVEVNPRYTASVEVLERTWNMPLIAWHVRACEGVLPVSLEGPKRGGWHGKRIAYTDHAFTASMRFCRTLDRWNRQFAQPVVADLPVEGTHVRSGRPLVTVFASASDERQVIEALAARERAVKKLAQRGLRRRGS